MGGREGIRNGMDGVEGRERGGFIGRWWIGGFARGFGLAGWIGGDEEQPRSQDDSVAQGAIRWPEVCSVLCSFEISLCVCVGSGWGQPANGPSYFRADVFYVCFIIWPALVWAKVTQRANLSKDRLTTPNWTYQWARLLGL